MAFEDIKERISTKAEESLCSMRLYQRKGGKCSLIVAIKAALVKSLQWTVKGGDIALAIGTGDDAGKIMMWQSGTPVARWHETKGGSLVLDFGYIAALGEVAREKSPAKNTSAVVEDGVQKLLVVLPNPWEASHLDENEDEEEAPRSSPARTEQPKPANQLASRPAPSAPVVDTRKLPPLAPLDRTPLRESVENDGVRVTISPPCIWNGGKCADLISFDARFAMTLVPALGKVMDQPAIKLRLGIPVRSDTELAAMLGQAAIRIKQVLPKIGLELRTIAGMGWVLKRGTQ